MNRTNELSDRELDAVTGGTVPPPAARVVVKVIARRVWNAIQEIISSS